MKKTKHSIFTILFIMMFAVLAACGGNDTSTGGEGGASDAEASSDGETIKIALMADFSGQSAPIGPGAENVAELAVSEINEAGGVLGKQVELLIGDSGSDPQIANEQAEKMYEKNDVEALLLTYNRAKRQTDM